jgi:deoxyribodipyrimidine photolyase
MQQRQQREVAGVVVYVLARVAFTLKVDSSVQRRQWMHLQSSLQRIQRRLRSRQYTLHSVVAQDVRELR